MKKFFAFIIPIIIISFVYFIYRHPYTKVHLSGNLDHPPVIVTASYLSMPFPKDIHRNLKTWQESIYEKHLYFRSSFSSFDVSYETVVDRGRTIVYFSGLCHDKNGNDIIVSESIEFPFSLYYSKVG